MTWSRTSFDRGHLSILRMNPCGHQEGNCPARTKSPAVANSRNGWKRLEVFVGVCARRIVHGSDLFKTSLYKIVTKLENANGETSGNLCKLHARSEGWHALHHGQLPIPLTPMRLQRLFGDFQTKRPGLMESHTTSGIVCHIQRSTCWLEREGTLAIQVRVTNIALAPKNAKVARAIAVTASRRGPTHRLRS